MGWIHADVADHEGWVANVLVDGRTSGALTGHGVLVSELTGGDIAAHREVRRFAGTDVVDVVVPWTEVACWRVCCACGWTGGQRPAFVTDLTRGRRDCPEEIEDEVFRPEWHAHIAPYRALAQLRNLGDQLCTVEQQLTAQVWGARAAGASWAQIGAELRMSKQEAQQRWNDVVGP